MGARQAAAARGVGRQRGPAPGTRPKKFDIVRAADWVVALVTGGLEHPGQPPKPPKKETSS